MTASRLCVRSPVYKCLGSCSADALVVLAWDLALCFDTQKRSHASSQLSYLHIFVYSILRRNLSRHVRRQQGSPIWGRCEEHHGVRRW